MKPSTPAAPDHARRTRTTAAAFLIGLPLAAAILGAIHYGPLHETFVARYVEHTVEWVEVVLFCCALGTLGAKLGHNVSERRACRAAVLPPWDGRPVPVAQAPDLLAGLGRLPRRLRNTYLAQRVAAVLDFLCQRRSTDELDDHLRTLVDNDSLALEGSYALTRFITWAIPILGFLGTVLGITGAISGVKSDDLQIGSITGGLAYAFDATALALALTMVTMFCSFLVERQEQAILEAVDRYVDRHLAHRFQRPGGDSGPFVEVVRQNTQVLLDATGQLAQRQAELWARALAETERRAAEAGAHQQERLAAALETALERTLEAHARRLAALEHQSLEQGARLYEQLAALAGAVRDAGREQQAALARVAEGVAAQAGALAGLQEGSANLVQLQALLQQNLSALAGTGAFEQAVHSLAAAVHLLTARAGAVAGPPRAQLGRAA